MLSRSVGVLVVMGTLTIYGAPALFAEEVSGHAGLRDATVRWQAKKQTSSGSRSGQDGASQSDIPAGSTQTLKRGPGGGAPAPLPEYDPLQNNAPAALYSRAFIPECWNAGVELAECLPSIPGDPTAPGAGGAAAPAPPTRAQVEAVVRSLVARLRLPDAVPQVGPDPSVNEWNMAVVGHPLWLWVEGPTQVNTNVSGYGVTIRMDARRVGLSFAMGDGAVVRCSATTPYPVGVEPGTPSPTCGHTYSKASLPQGSYRVTATAHWAINWSAIGYSGTIPLDIDDSRDLPVGELQAVVVR